MWSWIPLVTIQSVNVFALIRRPGLCRVRKSEGCTARTNPSTILWKKSQAQLQSSLLEWRQVGRAQHLFSVTRGSGCVVTSDESGSKALHSLNHVNVLFRQGFQTMTPYSRTGRTRARQAFHVSSQGFRDVYSFSPLSGMEDLKQPRTKPAMQ